MFFLAIPQLGATVQILPSIQGMAANTGSKELFGVGFGPTSPSCKSMPAMSPLSRP
jgi:hypothetical protein